MAATIVTSLRVLLRWSCAKVAAVRFRTSQKFLNIPGGCPVCGSSRGSRTTARARVQVR